MKGFILLLLYLTAFELLALPGNHRLQQLLHFTSFKRIKVFKCLKLLITVIMCVCASASRARQRMGVLFFLLTRKVLIFCQSIPALLSWAGSSPGASPNYVSQLCFPFPSLRFKKIIPIPEQSMVQMLCYLLECLLTEDNTPPDCPKELYELYFVFAAVWAFGGSMFQDQVRRDVKISIFQQTFNCLYFSLFFFYFPRPKAVSVLLFDLET